MNKTHYTITDELLDQLLANYQKPALLGDRCSGR
jgi:hypothetical protein